MSIRAMKWAWSQALRPTHKLILLALADLADEAGECWPSVSTIAKQCGVSTRTVRRVLGDLASNSLLAMTIRHRSDGSTTSNRYRLAAPRVDDLPAASDIDDIGLGYARHGATDASVLPGSTTRSQIDPSPLPRPHAAPPVDVRGGDRESLRFPAALTDKQRLAAKQVLVSLPVDAAQKLIDELAWRMTTGGIRRSPIAYLRGMIVRELAGTFESTALPGVLRQSGIAKDERASAPTPEPQRAPAPVYPEFESNPLCQRAAELHRRAQENRSGGSEETPAISTEMNSASAKSDGTSDERVSPPKPLAYLRRVIGE